MTAAQATATAQDVLIWLAGEDDLLPVFLGATGAEAADLRRQAEDPAFLVSLLDFLLMDDAWIMSAAASLSIPPEKFREARYALPGGQDVHWT
ncbi:DUF3572 family protein [Palleronia caenipelagi]|uniref:DUF3572 family protein n=2 Tax=Palleronia caenipelagi TaxID=2489174 RepID=A0A547QAE4_9RHOB|nr:DUF3572 domain-containing protein [Palleronia caenipelagi]TRD23351.1 DUF3572 family protein [Palleronia caenipelagi]